jgi:hypothetical protein
VTLTATGGEAGGWTLAGGGSGSYSGVEQLSGTAHGDLIDLSAGSAGQSVWGNAGADTLTGSTGADMIQGGADADLFHASASGGADLLFGGEGGTDFDTMTFADGPGGQGVSVVFGGWEYGTYSYAGGGATGQFWEMEAVSGTAWSDTLDASASGGGASLAGGGGADLIRGGSGADTLAGGTGADTLRGGAGDDSLAGGSGYDVFVLTDGSGHDTVADFDMGDGDGDGRTNDQIDVSGLSVPVLARDVVVSDDGFGNALLTFPGGETLLLTGVAPAQISQNGQLMAAGIPCFCAGTRIATPGGAVPVERLCAGDLVSTEAGPARVIWSGRRRVTPADVAANPALAPVRVASGTLGNPRALKLSGQHGVRIGTAAGPVLVRARHLARWLPGVRVVTRAGVVDYHHVLLERHALLWAEGVACESFYPGRQALAWLGPADLSRLLALRPRLASVLAGASPADAYGTRVLPLLDQAEARRVLGAAPPPWARTARPGQPAAG